jgi:hypothetical protein
MRALVALLLLAALAAPALVLTEFTEDAGQGRVSGRWSAQGFFSCSATFEGCTGPGLQHFQAATSGSDRPVRFNR